MMWTPLPSPSPLPKVASAPVSPAKATVGFSQATNQVTHLAFSQVANASAGPQASQRSAETQGGFARALQQAAAHDSAAHNKPSEPSETEGAPADAAATGTPNRFDSAAKAAQSRAAAARLERSQAAATAPASQRQGSPSAPDEPASGAATATSPSTDETPSQDATWPEAGAVGALLSQLRAAAAATSDSTQPADQAAVSLAAAQTASARAGRSTSATLTPTADGPAAHRTALLSLGEPASLTAGPGQPGDGSWAAASGVAAAASSALQASSAEHAGTAVLAANLQPGPDAQPLLSSALAGAHLGLHSAPPAGSPTGATPTAGEAHLSAPLGSPDFGPQLGAQITTFVRDGLEHARLQLNPANMGPVLVQIQLDGQTAQVHLSAEHASTRQALEDAMPQLASQLREAGLTLSGGGVSEQAQQGRQAPSPTPPERAPSAEPTEAVVLQPRPATARRGVVDLVA